MKRIILFLFLILLFSSCKKLTSKVAGPYHGNKTCTDYSPSLGRPVDTSFASTETVIAINENQISIEGLTFSYQGMNNGNYTFTNNDSGGLTSTANFDGSFRNLSLYVDGPGVIDGCTFSGSR